ncbi:MAG TPA: hypothetical protein GX742_03545 [Acholeplasmataceae bacterium]|nr:hypothetical protein [Acholeplasmataceae bacterium]
MAAQLESVIKAERTVKQKIAKAQEKRTELITKAIEEGTLEANRIHDETEALIEQKIEENNQQIDEIDEKLQNVVMLENEKIIKKVSAKIEQITEQIYKEALSND